MTLAEKIKKSKVELKASQRNNVSSELLNFYDELIKRPDDKGLALTIPVSIVSANESFFKEAFAAIINLDKKYLENSKSIIKKHGVKFELDELFHISKSSLSLGDIVAFTFKYSSIESILKTFQEITGIDVLTELESFKEDILELDILNLISDERPLDKVRVIKNLKEAYEVRNIICHDFLSSTHKLTIDTNKLFDYILDAALLQYAIDFICSDKIYSKYIPLDDDLRYQHYKEKIVGKRNQLERLYDEIRKTFHTSKQSVNFENNIKSFEAFVKNDSIYLGRFWFNDIEDSFPFEELALEHEIKLLDQRINIIEEQINSS